MAEGGPSSPVSLAYDELAEGLRALAAEIERVADRQAAEALGQADVERGAAPARESVEAALRGVFSVTQQALLLGLLLGLGFQVWITLAPPLRPHL